MSRFTLQLGFWTAVILTFLGTAYQVILAGALKSGTLVTMESASSEGFWPVSILCFQLVYPFQPAIASTAWGAPPYLMIFSPKY
jgi:hypothetical protein